MFLCSRVGGTEAPNTTNTPAHAVLVIRWKGGRPEKHANTKNMSKQTCFCYWNGGGEDWGAEERLGGCRGGWGRQRNTRMCPQWAHSHVRVHPLPPNTKNVHVGTFYMFGSRGCRRGRQEVPEHKNVPQWQYFTMPHQFWAIPMEIWLVLIGFRAVPSRIWSEW